MILGLLLIGLFFQGVLAIAVYRDAYSRGVDEGVWTVIAVLFGIVGVLLYLLARPDQTIPEDEREQAASTQGLKTIGVYSVAVIVGVIIAMVIGIGVADTFYSNSIPEGCDRLEFVDANEPVGPCEITKEEYESDREMRNMVAWMSLLGGAGLGPLGLYSIRNRERLGERLPV
ncbi:hypothetical protein NDI56_15895 [Haloarcula sp. S1CR25-12]|uniref:Uncharacterized protein n=1 Tax=Haloarcula saliterrae TaxID=2950534 RepID=A0ABU2FF53_9EURY|nr:hypothetical protein [Haloarcula sp. S1CR25-12]MDS0260888.1 hypothetical protein [Haloarcula sp. S1CR25-12]